LEDLTGKKLGNYEVLKLIGKGGMAAVYEAVQPSMNRNVAIKVMDERFSKSPTFVARFRNEANIIARLEHAHILPVYDFGDQDDILYIVMRFLPTGTLEDRIGISGVELKDAVKYIRQIASALDYAHSKGVIHRDLKPGNVMIDNQDNTFLTDFGIAKSVESDQRLTKTDNVVGTPLYMSPEQSMGEELDGRADVYALGVMLFEMLTGKLPYTGETPMAVVLKHINDPIPSILSQKRNLPDSLDNVISKAMAKERGDRYDTASALADDVEEVYHARQTGRQPRLTADDTAASIPATEMFQTPEPRPAAAGGTLQSPVQGAAPTVMAESARTNALSSAEIGQVSFEFNALSRVLVERAGGIGLWLQAALLSVATFLALGQLTSGGLPQNLLLSLVPGIIIYGALHAPTVGGIVSMGLILIPLLAHAPGLAIIWAILIIFAGARMTSREIMLTVVSMLLASTPLGWIMPLAAPWWFKARRTALAAALGVFFATIFAVTIGWRNAGGLLPVPSDISLLIQSDSISTSDVAPGVTISGDPFGTSYLGLFTNPEVWSGYQDVGAVTDSIVTTYALLGNLLRVTRGLPLVIATVWALAAVLSVSNRRVQSPLLRPVGILLALGALSTVTFLNRSDNLIQPTALAILTALSMVVLAFLITQWPLQADPNQGNQIGTFLRMLRQSLGAFYMALGLVFMLQFLTDAPTLNYIALWLLGTIGIMATITDPMVGPPIFFTGLIIGMAPVDTLLTGVLAGLLILYLIVAFLFDRRRPRRWIPMGAGLLIGSPGIAGVGLLPFAVLSIGALESQVPAAIFALASHVLLVITSPEQINALNVIVQLLVTVSGVFLVERFMALGFLGTLPAKVRRLIFTVLLAPIMAFGYYLIGGVSLVIPGPAAFILAIASAAVLVASLGERARFWRQFFEREEEEDELLDDEEVTGILSRAG